MAGSDFAALSSRRSGFTLLELIVALTIAGALIALAPPLISRVLPGVKLKGASQEMASAMRFLRSWSVAQGKEGLLTLDLEKKSYTISPRKRVYELPETAELTLVSAADERLDEHRGRVRFFPDGSSTGGRITLQGAGDEHQIDVDWLTGRVTLVH